MRILLCAEITCGSKRKTVNLHVKLVSDVMWSGLLLVGGFRGGLGDLVAYRLRKKAHWRGSVPC
jgi:hypothetical protein